MCREVNLSLFHVSDSGDLSTFCFDLLSFHLLYMKGNTPLPSLRLALCFFFLVFSICTDWDSLYYCMLSYFMHVYLEGSTLLPFLLSNTTLHACFIDLFPQPCISTLYFIYLCVCVWREALHCASPSSEHHTASLFNVSVSSVIYL